MSYMGGNDAPLLGIDVAGAGALCPSISRGPEECWLLTIAEESAGGNTRNDKRFMKQGL